MSVRKKRLKYSITSLFKPVMISQHGSDADCVSGVVNCANKGKGNPRSITVVYDSITVLVLTKPNKKVSY